ncbi:MAG TPA: IMP dehydrogenase [Patescibacteria group bacterium]|nr:IMP dehydrogenase [Patescibacteria group bacterium]
MEPSNSSLPQALTFNDVLLIPGFSDFLRDEINLSTYLTKKIKLSIPLISSPMDTVTEAPLAIALARVGGVGIIHRNLAPNEQANEVSKVKKENLLVGAAIGPNKGFEERAKLLVKANVDVIVIDSAHGFTKFTIDTIKYLKMNYPKVGIIAGNIATYDGAMGLINAGADALRVGMGPGAICTTRIISGMGVPQITALRETVRAAKKTKTPVIADGGMSNSGDMVKALAAGASTVMMGSFFASTLESPGKKVTLPESEVPRRFKSIFGNNGKYIFKEYRGMGSEAAMKTGAKTKSEGEFHGKSYKDRTLVAEGVEGLVPIKGTVRDVVDIAVGGIKSGFYYCGFKTIEDCHKAARFMQITQASLQESHPHDILVTNAGKSYS